MIQDNPSNKIPNSFFSLISPLMSILVAWTGYKIHHKKVQA